MDRLAVVCTQSIYSLNMAIQNFLCNIRDGYINDDRSCGKVMILIGVEAGLLLNIPIGVIEVIVRAILAIITYPCRTKSLESYTWVGAIISTSYVISDILAFFRGFNFNQKIKINDQMRNYLPCLYTLNTWAMSTPREFARDPRRIRS